MGSNDKKFYISVGYPLGYKIENETFYVIEIDCENSMVSLSPDEFQLWSRIRSLQAEAIKQSSVGILKSLIEKKALIECVEGDVYEKISPLNILRQGLGWLNGNTTCIALGHDFIGVTPSQYNIWLRASGFGTANDIFDAISEQAAGSIVEERNNFSSALMTMLKNDVLRLRYMGG